MCRSFVVDQWSQADRPFNGAMPAKWGGVNNVTHLQEMTNGLTFPAAPPNTVGGFIAGALDLYYNSPNDAGYQAGYNYFNASF